MALACECPSDYDGEAAWYYYAPSNFNILETTKRKRCISCGKLIDIGANVLEFQRYRYPITEIEEKILGRAHRSLWLRSTCVFLAEASIYL